MTRPVAFEQLLPFGPTQTRRGSRKQKLVFCVALEQGAYLGMHARASDQTILKYAESYRKTVKRVPCTAKMFKLLYQILYLLTEYSVVTVSAFRAPRDPCGRHWPLQGSSSQNGVVFE